MAGYFFPGGDGLVPEFGDVDQCCHQGYTGKRHVGQEHLEDEAAVAEKPRTDNSEAPDPVKSKWAWWRASWLDAGSRMICMMKERGGDEYEEALGNVGRSLGTTMVDDSRIRGVCCGECSLVAKWRI
jgi:hypothetical protein